jgi:nicotinamide riboside kinase
MEEYAQEDEELWERFRELRISLNDCDLISNTVHLNEKLARECKFLQSEIERMRLIMLDTKVKYDKFEDRITR